MFSQIIFYFEKIFTSVWNIISGAAYLGWRLRRKEKQEQELDTSYYFKKRSKKEMAQWQVREQMYASKVWKTIKWLPPKKKFIKNKYLYHNYFAGVLAPQRQNQTPDQMLLEYWEKGVAPYFLIHLEALNKIKSEICDDGVSEVEAWNRINHILKSLPNLEERAKRVMEAQKEVMLKMRKESEKLKADRKKYLDERDKQMLDIDEAILQNKMNTAKTNLEAIQKSRKVNK